VKPCERRVWGPAQALRIPGFLEPQFLRIASHNSSCGAVTQLQHTIYLFLYGLIHLPYFNHIDHLTYFGYLDRIM